MSIEGTGGLKLSELAVASSAELAANPVEFDGIVQGTPTSAKHWMPVHVAKIDTWMAANHCGHSCVLFRYMSICTVWRGDFFAVAYVFRDDSTG